MPEDHAPLTSEAAPAEFRDPFVRQELRRAGIWLGLVLAGALAVLLVQPILVVFAGVVLAALLDGGVRLLGRVLPIGRGWRLLIVVLGVTIFLIGTFVLTGVEVVQQASQLRDTLQMQAGRVMEWLRGLGLDTGSFDPQAIAKQALGSVGRITGWLGAVLGALTSLAMILVLGLFFAMEPKVYERGLQWMVPTDARPEFARTLDRMGRTLRRLLAGRLFGMAVEGVFTGIALMVGGVPMALLLGIIAGILAFIPNIGAIITGVLMIAVGFSAGSTTGLWAVATYCVVQTIDGYVVVPIVARKTVDLPPALTLTMQIALSALFGILGLALADPFTAMAKTALERRAEREEETGDVAAA